MTDIHPTATQATTARTPSEPIGIGEALAELLPHLRTCSATVGIDGHCGRPATNGECTYHADERAAFYTTPKGR